MPCVSFFGSLNESSLIATCFDIPQEALCNLMQIAL